MELRHLRYYVAVAEELNYRRAAERVRVAQPALSKQIKDLEFDVGVRLLNRNTAGVELTDAGQVFLDEARTILQRAEEAILMARAAAAGTRGTLKIANVSAISAGFMPAALSAYHARYPEVDVALEELMLPEQIGALDQAGVHLGFAIDREEAIPEHLSRLRVLESELVVVVGRKHRLARRQQISLHDLGEERLLCIETSRHDMHRQRIKSLFVDRGLTPGRFKSVSSLESLYAMIEGDQGVSFLVAMPTGNRRNDGLVHRPVKERGDDLKVAIYAIWRREGRSKLVTNFVDVLKEICGSEADY